MSFSLNSLMRGDHIFLVVVGELQDGAVGGLLDDLCRIDVEQVSRLHVAAVDRVVPEADTHELLAHPPVPAVVVALGGGGEDQKVLLKAFDVAAAVQAVSHFVTSWKRGRPRPRLFLLTGSMSMPESRIIFLTGAVPSG